VAARETTQTVAQERSAFAELELEHHTASNVVGHTVNAVVMPKVNASAVASQQVVAPSVVPQSRPSSPETTLGDLYDGAGEGEFLRTDVAHSEVKSERAEPNSKDDSERAEPLGYVKTDFVAAWEVDRFEFEEIVWELCAETSPLWQAAEQLEVACREGLKVLAITSPARGQGRSTLAITMARMLAATGLNVALIDGDLDKPSLADKMRLEIRLGWGDAVRTGLSVEEVAVQSVEDGFTVLPLATPDSSKGLRPAADTTSKMISQLRDAFDVVVIDTANINVIGGWIPGADSPSADSRCQIDAALVIQDLRREDPEAMQACLRRLHKLGIANIGLVENFSGE
jgi:Mrp family chromosome partitioning ATPase